MNKMHKKVILNSNEDSSLRCIFKLDTFLQLRSVRPHLRLNVRNEKLLKII